MTKIAILGGGVGGMTAAWELSDPALGHEITVYQLGWRLGGKGASGRNAGAGQRIEEHGLHVWFGFYRNAFDVMRQVYEALGRETGPIRTVDQAFTPCSTIVLGDRVGGSWHFHPMTVSPEPGGHPWEFDGPGRLPSVWRLVVRAVRLMRDALTAFTGNQDPGVPPSVFDDLDAAESAAEEQDDPSVTSLRSATAAFAFVVDRLEDSRATLAAAWAGAIDGPLAVPRVRMIFTTFDVLVSAGRGILADDVLHRGFGVVDDRDLTEWLVEHGLTDVSYGETFQDRAPALRAIYDVAFCFERGDVEHGANAAAGTAVNDLLQLLFTFRGELAYKMNAGMGDAIFAPLYDALVTRGVTFKFFHAVTGLTTSDGETVDGIDLLEQIELPEGFVYDPLESVGGLRSWPNLPRPTTHAPQLGDRRARRLELEHDPFERQKQNLGGRRLRRGEDFDDVVLAIPVGALSPLTGQLQRANPAFRRMVEGGRTVQTQAFQLWTTTSPEKLGRPRFDGRAIQATYVEPLDTYCDMRQVLPLEDWDGEVKGLAYVCGVLEEGPEGETQQQADDRVETAAKAFVEHALPTLWPDAGADVWAHLHDPEDRQGPARFAAQYHRANIAAWERYVITPANNPATRLKSHESGFLNLFLAGDWTDNGINGGCVEAAVVSGLQAARSITKQGIDGGSVPTIGEDDTWLTPPT